MGPWPDIVVFIWGGVSVLSAVIQNLNISRSLRVIGLGFILLSILSFFVFPILRIVEIVLIFIFLAFQLCNLLVWMVGKNSACPNTICVPGAQVRNNKIGPTFTRRLRLALRLYHKYNESPYIAVCGGKGADETVSEAYAGSEYLISHGVDPKKIIREEASQNTFESFVNLSQLLPDKNGTVLIATSGYGVLRAVLLAEKARLNAKAVGCRDPFFVFINYSLREIPAMVYRVIGTKQRRKLK